MASPDSVTIYNMIVYQIIPRSVLENAKGFAIFTVFKAGFLFSARAGTGIVIAKLPNGCEFPTTYRILRDNMSTCSLVCS